MLIIDDNGQTIPNVVRDDKGNPIIDENEMFKPNVKVDKKSNPILDALGNSIARVILNAAGNPFLDKKGNATDLDGKCVPVSTGPTKAIPPPKVIEDLPTEIYLGEIPREEDNNEDEKILVLTLPPDVFQDHGTGSNQDALKGSKRGKKPVNESGLNEKLPPKFFESQLPEPAKPLNERDSQEPLSIKPTHKDWVDTVANLMKSTGKKDPADKEKQSIPQKSKGPDVNKSREESVGPHNVYEE